MAPKGYRPSWKREDGLFRINVYLRIYPGALPPAAVGKRLDLEPTRFVIADDPLAAAPDRKARPNGWFIDSEHLVDSDDPLVHLEWMLQLLESRQSRLEILLERPDAHAYVGLTLWTEQGGCSIEIPPALLRRLAKLELPFWVDFSDYP